MLRLAVALSCLIAVAVAGAPSEVTVDGRQLVVRKRLADGTFGPAAPYVIRGVIWSPVTADTNTSPADPNNATVRRAEFAGAVGQDVPLLSAMNVNTVRMLIDPGTDASGLAVVDALWAAGIMVVMNVDDGVNDLARVPQVVQFYKDHPAILMWTLGSEWNINRYFGVAACVQEAAHRTERAAAMIKALDPGHPVASSYGEIDINAPGLRLEDTRRYVNEVCPSVDVWALNVYRGNSVGNLFAQWSQLTSKPMLLGEFGTDAFRSAGLGVNPPGSVDGVMQAQWDLAQWNELFANLSARTPEAVALGGFVFEWMDEWWKVHPWEAHDTGGFIGAQPDSYFNEEYFGIVDIERNPRPLHTELATAFAPAYEPPATNSYRVISRGSPAQEYPFQNGTIWFFRNGAKLHSATGGAGGGRGFTVAVFDPATGLLRQPIQHFDTYASRQTGTAFCELNTLLDNVPNGMLIVMGVGDESGLAQFPPNDCLLLNAPCKSAFLQRLAALGSDQADSICYWDSWAFAAVKGEGVARSEARGNGVEVAASTTLPIPTRSVALTIDGNGAVRSVPGELRCSSSCTAPFALGSSLTLHPAPAPGWSFSGWSGDCSGSAPCTLTMAQNAAVTASFVNQPAAPAVAPQSASADPNGELLKFAVTAPAGASWTASTITPWLEIAGSAGGVGNGLVKVRIAASDGLARSGTVTIAGTSISIDQRRGAVVTFSSAGLSGGGNTMTGTLSGPAPTSQLTYLLSGTTCGAGNATVGTGTWSLGPILFKRGVTNVILTATDEEGNVSRTSFPTVHAFFIWP